MSLINDALKRASEAQPKNQAPAAGPTMRPVEIARRPGPVFGFLLPLLILLALLFGGIMVWLWFQEAGGDMKVRARSYPSAVNPVSAPANPPATTVATPAPVAPTNAIAAAAAVLSTNASPVVEPPKPLAVVYKLQSIFYRRRDPSVVINGKTLFVGDRVAHARVVAIDQDTATIVISTGETNTLELSH
ncbi:MAG: hypothetical protein JWR26_4950 [Pedosphaera sp.]|nr:hypothetical protein [Pedosphaera sp.]